MPAWSSTRKLIRPALQSSLATCLRQLRSMTDWKQYGGAPLLGFDKVIIKAHGRSNARAIGNAIKVASKAVDRDLTGRIRAGLVPSE